MFVGKAMSLPSSGAIERYFTRVGSRLSIDKHNNLLQTLVYDGLKNVWWYWAQGPVLKSFVHPYVT